MVKRKGRVAVDSSDDSNSNMENSDVDSELLSLARKRKKKSVSSIINSPDKSNSEEETVGQKPQRMKKNHKKKIESDSEPEEGELTDTDSSDLSQEEFNDGYGSDLMGDDEDRRRLSQMTEKEREQEIYKRIEAREVMRTRFNIERKLKQAKKQEMKNQKSSYSGLSRNMDTPLDLKERVLERKKTVEENRGKSSDKKFQAMNLLKARREEKREREEKEKQMKIEQEKQRSEQMSKEKETDLISRGNKTKLKASDVYSDDSVSSSDEESLRKELDTEKVSSSSSSSDSETDRTIPSEKLKCITTPDELNSIRLSRFKLEKLVHLPFFKKVAVGSFVRIMFGTNNTRPIYRICEISDVCETGKIYQLGNTRTNKGLRLKYGVQERVLRMEFVSNQEFTTSEFGKWREVCADENVSVPTIENIETKLRDIQEAMSYEYKEEDVEKIVKEKERFKTTPYNYAMKKTQLMKERDMAQSDGDSAKVTELQDQLNELEERATNLDRLRTSTISSISYINNRNRRRNVEEAEKAILAELRATKGQRSDDPFTRRHTKPSMVIKAKKQPESSSVAPSQPVISGVTEENESSEKNDNSNETKKNNPQKHSEDMYAAHDFEITIDFDVPISVTPIVTPTPILNPVTTSNSRSLNLEDYKRRKGFI